MTLLDAEAAEAKRHPNANKQNLALIFNTPWIFKLVLIGMVWAALQQTTGVNVIMYYGTEILKTAGFLSKHL